MCVSACGCRMMGGEQRVLNDLCTGDLYYVLMYGAVNFLNVLKKGCWGRGGGVCYWYTMKCILYL